MRFFAQIVTIALSAASVMAATTCKTSDGHSGTCININNCDGISLIALCPGAAAIRCCIPSLDPNPPSRPFNATAVIAAARKRLGVPYSWGGGHRGAPGPSLGTCVGYSGSIKPCPADKTVGLDCSGLVRDAIYHGYGVDLAHGGNTDGQLADPHTQEIKYADRQPGDIEFFGTRENTVHVILYIGKNSTGGDMMIEAQKTGTNVHEVPLRTGGIWARVR
ncbi:hypothetical protein BGZ50_006934 [Haplosporangium sp. Z 11]|nr:hypothetical protein BGZ50_006934 [Haplosporangium sp. Z 11]